MSTISKEWQEHQRKRWMRPDAARWLRPDAARYMRHDAWRFLPPEEQLQHKYRPDQPRVPAGNPDGGQWTAEGLNNGADEESFGTSDEANGDITIELSAAGRKGDGHHYSPGGVMKKYNLSDEAKEVFGNSKTGPLWDSRSNKWDGPHREYNEAVEELFDAYLDTHKIEPSIMTRYQAWGFLAEIFSSTDPRIRDFNMRIWMREIAQRLLRRPGPRE